MANRVRCSRPGLGLGRRLLLLCASIVLFGWGCSITMNWALDATALYKPEPIVAEFVDRSVAVPASEDVRLQGDVLLARPTKPRTTRGGVSRDMVDETWVIPIEGISVGAPVQILSRGVSEIGPGGRYAVSPGNLVSQFISLRDRRVVLDLRAGSYIFIDDHRLLAFGFGRDYAYGDAAIIDLDARTVQNFEAHDMTLAVSPRFIIDGEVDLCELKDTSGGSGADCVSFRRLDLDTGESWPREERPPPAVSDSGEYVFAAVCGSRAIGDEVIYFPGELGCSGREHLRLPLMRGSRSGPADTDERGGSPVGQSSTILMTTDEQWVIADGSPTAAGPGMSVCDVRTLTCAQLDVDEGTVPLGIIPADVLG